ncbi:30S ribosome-binding factor RbfA [Sphingosinicella microcystinivorans]|uniref:Ribosome-binding factor A n=1 Tax=Sphingosinicella microcystinivorans TaxID=335406 RepID=A0AAD1D5B9_SPHMI|nr:30S ribosome-binding factor RbfA [Sphingosinicella microcystinivorans]RKS90838.1 ribosome-binding factor A [Sphingosinicella microcystinivorans]BBE33754.1 ribosome-binding factor A [Sphingosinicella microcystinivorans]
MRQTQTPEGKSVRLLRIGEQVRHVLAGVLGRGEVRDPVLETHIVSVSEVRVSPDLRIATAFVKALGGDDDEVLAALKRNAKYLRGEVARSMSTKYTPELKFRLDESYEEASRIDALLRDPKVARDLEE